MAELAPSATRCRSCGAELSSAVLVCPLCSALVHSEELKRLAAEAERAEAEGNPGTALARWRSALELLPAESRQHGVVSERAARLSRSVEAASPSPDGKPEHSGLGKGLAWMGALGLALWKLKFLAVLVLTKGKLLLLGLTKASTVFSMLLSFGVYWAAWGWKFAAGLVAAIYVHEMGHIAALRRFGIGATAPMFVPGFGALVRMQQRLVSVREDARVGLAGPLWGLGASFAAWLIAEAAGWESFKAIAHVSAWINLFNLMPIWSLDGGRGFRALSRRQRGWACVALLAAWFLTEESLFVLLAITGGFRFFGKDAPEEPDRGALWTYVGLVAGLALLLWIAPQARL